MPGGTEHHAASAEEVASRVSRSRRRAAAAVTVGLLLVSLWVAGAFFGLPLPRRDPNGSPQPQPERMVASGTVQGHRWSIVATRGEGEPGACALLRLDGRQLSGSCGYTETPDSHGFAPQFAELPGGRDLLFGPLPQDAASVKLTLPDGTVLDAPARPVPGLPGKFFYLISPTRLGCTTTSPSWTGKDDRSPSERGSLPPEQLSASAARRQVRLDGLAWRLHGDVL